MLAPFSGPWLVCTTKVYPGLGADIVMESIALMEGIEGNRTSLSRLRLALQDPHDRNYGVPIPCRRRHAVKLVDLAKTANRLHMATVHSKHKLAF